MDGWKHVMCSYFSGEPARSCFVEEDPAIASKPLWPFEPRFDPACIEKNLQETRKILSPLGGQVFWGHIPLNANRGVDSTISLQPQPERLASVFVSGYVMPHAQIQDSAAGYYVHNGIVPDLSDITRGFSGSWLMSNLGYFLTQKLILPPDEGGFPYSHNVRHPPSEQLQATDNCYLGGFRVRDAGGDYQFPPLQQSGALAITHHGKPVLLGDTQLRGGKVHLAGRTLRWTAADVNPTDPDDRDVVVYTPTFAPHHAQVRGGAKAWQAYRYGIGAGRFNVVISNRGTGTSPRPIVSYTVQGECLHPADAIVISCRAPVKVQRGDEVQFDLEPWCEAVVFNEATCIYEGLMPIDTSGKLVFGPWQHPNSCLTQETQIPVPQRREPRSALICTDRYFGAIVFSGRYELSIGVSLMEMGPIIGAVVRRVLPAEPVRQILCLDGGSCAKICLIQDGRIKPLSWVAPGFRNRMGDPNGNTYSCFFIRTQ